MDHLPNYAIHAYKFIKKKLVFCEEHAIFAFRSIIIYWLTCFLHLIYIFIFRYYVIIRHLSFLFTRRMGHWECVLIIEHSTRQRWKTGILCFGLMIYLIVFRKPRCLVRSTYVRDITKFGLQKGTKKIPLVAQGMAHTSSWWCLLGSPMHPPHFALSW
jgi:hypothetical protein